MTARAAASRKALERFVDREWRLDNLYYIQDEAGRRIKFVRNEAQRAFWRDLWYLNIVLKARQLGFSTFIAILILDACLFNSNTSAGIVDATIEDAELKLAKIKFAYDNLPPELKQIVRLTEDNRRSMAWSNGSSISVGTSHRGGTLQYLHVSEYGKISVVNPRKSNEIRRGAFGTIHRGQFIFVESTAEGAAGDFYELVQDADAMRAQGKELAQSEFKLHFYPWWKHPGYIEDPSLIVVPKELNEYFEELRVDHGIDLTPEQKAWYAAKRKQVGFDDMFREYPSYPEEAFKVSVEGAYFKSQMMRLREERRIGKVPIDPSKPVHTCWDIGKGDSTAIWFFQNHGNMIHLVHYYENSGEGVEFYARTLREIAEKRKFVYGKHYGPHDLDNSHWVLPGAKSIKDAAYEVGIDFIVVPRIANKQDAIEAARIWLSMCWIDEENCEQGIRCLDNYRKEWDDKRGCYKSDPLHDWASHGADALMTGACGFTPDYVPPPIDRYARRTTRSSAWAA